MVAFVEKGAVSINELISQQKQDLILKAVAIHGRLS
jgi:hypothetical protein